MSPPDETPSGTAEVAMNATPRTSLDNRAIGAFGARLGPRDAYRFAQGEEVEIPETWDCPRCGLPASLDSENPPPPPEDKTNPMPPPRPSR